LLDPRTEGGAFRISVAAAVVVWLALSWPLLTGSSALYLRDNFNLFLPLKAYGAEQLEAGRIPAVNTSWGLGQPFRGNPNAAAFYPGNLLYLAMPFWSAWGSHFAIHWLLAALTMATLARGLGSSREAACLAALTYAGSGWMLSALTFYTTTVVAAWWPLVLWGAVRGGRRGVCAGALACGLALLGGEVVLAALGMLPVAVFGIWQAGARRGIGRALAIAAGGALVAQPQLIAFTRVLPHSFRASHGVPAGQVGAYALGTERFLELLMPFPFSDPITRQAGLAGVAPARMPYILSIFFGLAALAMAANARARSDAPDGRSSAFWPCSALAASGLLLAWAGGPLAPVLKSLTFGLFRYPEKALFWLALALPLLAGAGLDRARRGHVDRKIWWILAAILCATLIATFAIGRETGSAAARDQLVRQVVVALLMVGLMAWAAARKQTAWLLGLQLISVLQLHPLWLTDDTSLYRRPRGLAERLDGASAVLPVRLLYPPWDDGASRPAGGKPYAATRANALALGQGPGVLHGLTYPAAPDVEGLHHVFFHFALFWTSQGTWSERIAWSRQLGVEAMAIDRELPLELGLAPHAAIEVGGIETRLYRLDDSPDLVWWPQRLELAASPRQAFELVAARSQASDAVAAPFAIDHAAGGRVTAVEHGPDHLSLEVSGGGGIAVVRRAFQPIWRARLGDRPLPVYPVDLTFLGVQVPAGDHRVELTIDSRPELWGAVAALAASGLLLLGLFTDRGGRALD
jgi:hypothetical protein